MKQGTLAILLFSLSTNVYCAPPTGDTQGVVEAVRVNSNSSGVDSFRIYFSSIQNDRWNCLQTDGYLQVFSNGNGVSATSYSQMYSMALASMTSGKALALDSGASAPCANVSAAMIID